MWSFGSTLRAGRLVGRLILAVGLVVLAVSCSSSKGTAGSNALAGTGSTTSPPGATSPSATLTVASTLDGVANLPHRIHWQARPSVTEGISEVDFLIDDETAWVEHNPPYFFGDDGGYLVTTFLKPGKHTFITRVVTVGGQSAESTVEASVAAAPSPPGGLSKMSWTRRVTASDLEKATSPEPPPTGQWGLTIDSVGWTVHDPEGGGLLFDVAYRADGKVQLQTSIERPPYPSPTGGAFCEEPDASAMWTYTMGDNGNTVTMHPVGHDPCGDRVAILEGTWTSKKG